MNAKAEVERSGADAVKLGLAVLLVVAGAVGFSMFSGQPLWVRLLGLLAILVLAAFIAMQTGKGRAAWRFFAEARTEVRKVVWPTRQETLQTSLAILVGVLIAALLLWVVDSALFALVRWLTGQGS